MLRAGQGLCSDKKKTLSPGNFFFFAFSEESLSPSLRKHPPVFPFLLPIIRPSGAFCRPAFFESFLEGESVPDWVPPFRGDPSTEE